MAEHKRCARCGRLLKSDLAKQTGYGEHCRRGVIRAVRVLVASGNKQAYKAAVLLAQANIKPIRRGRVWSVWGQTENYLTSANTCNCRAAWFYPTANSCYHSVACAILAGSEIPAPRTFAL